MSIYNEEEFKIHLNKKIYLINICILEDQLSLVLTLLSQVPKQYSGFFSLEELRISSEIFEHTKSLFEAKEIIKRTVIKNKLVINEDEHKSQITFDTGMGIDSIPFPIILFRDLNVNHLSKSQVLTTNKNLKENNNDYKLLNNNIENINQNSYLKASIGNNINNKMLNNIKIGQSAIINNRYDYLNNNNEQIDINKENIKNVIFNNRRSKIFMTNNINKEENLEYKKFDLIPKTNNNSTDYIKMNNQILFNIYNNMNRSNNINSSFYKNLQNSFINENNYINKNENNTYRNNLNNYQQNNIITNNQNYPPLNNSNIRKGFISSNPSHKTSPPSSPIRKNITRIPINDNMKSFILTKSASLGSKSIKNLFKKEKENKVNDGKVQDCIEEREEESIEGIDENIEEDNLNEKNYHFKNLVIKRPKKIKGNLEKFKQSQNLGDYTPMGKKFVSYLKFPDTKSNISSNNASTLSSSITSSLNRIPGLEKNIIKNPAELDEINLRIKRILQKRNVKYKLIFRATEHGDLSESFHEKCDNINNTLIIIYTSCNKRFGGFTTQSWDGEKIKKKDNDCFIFSIDKLKIYDILRDKNAIYCNPDYGPVFINQIKLLDKFFTQGGTTGNKGKTFQTEENFELTGGAELFGIKELEVYQVK